MAQFRHRYGAHAAGQQSYLDYVRMKDFLHARGDDENEALLDDDAPNSDSNIATFWDVFVEEITRVDKSFQISLSDIYELLNDFQALASSCNADTDRDKKLKKIQETFLKRIATVLHDKIAKLEDFRLINRTAAIKILKKFDKGATRNGGQPFYDIYLARMDKLEFGHGNSLVEAKRGLVELYAACFCEGEQEEALLKLSLSKAVISQEVKQWVALKMGVVIALLAWLVNDCIVSPQMSMIYLLGNDPSVYVYAAVGALITYRWFWGFSVYMWDSVGVDYMLVLSLDPNKHMPNCADIFSDAADLSILYLLNVLIFHILRFHYVHIDRLDEPSSVQYTCQYAYVMPVLLVAGTAVRAVGSFAQPISYGVFSTRIASRVSVVVLCCVLYRAQVKFCWDENLPSHSVLVLCLCMLTLTPCLIYPCFFIVAGAHAVHEGVSARQLCGQHPHLLHQGVVRLALRRLLLRDRRLSLLRRPRQRRGSRAVCIVHHQRQAAHDDGLRADSATADSLSAVSATAQGLLSGSRHPATCVTSCGLHRAAAFRGHLGAEPHPARRTWSVFAT